MWQSRRISRSADLLECRLNVEHGYGGLQRCIDTEHDIVIVSVGLVYTRCVQVRERSRADEAVRRGARSYPELAILEF